VINMRNNREISNAGGFHEDRSILAGDGADTPFDFAQGRLRPRTFGASSNRVGTAALGCPIAQSAMTLSSQQDVAACYRAFQARYSKARCFLHRRARQQ
jgi:hypothetical protein